MIMIFTGTMGDLRHSYWSPKQLNSLITDLFENHFLSPVSFVKKIGNLSIFHWPLLEKNQTKYL